MQAVRNPAIRHAEAKAHSWRIPGVRSDLGYARAIGTTGLIKHAKIEVVGRKKYNTDVRDYSLFGKTLLRNSGIFAE